jgi:hypothetical protein
LNDRGLHGLVPIFRFELKDDSERPRTSHSKKLSAGPRDGGFPYGAATAAWRVCQRTEEAARKLNLGTTRSLARAQYGAQTPDAKGRLG